MKFSTYDPNLYARLRGDLPKKKTLRSIAEMADEFGVSIASLRAALSHSNDSPPEPSVRVRNSSTGSGVYYEPHEMRAWWKRRQTDLNAVSKQP